MPIIINFYTEHIFLLPKLVSNYGLVMLDGYFGNYTLSVENYNPGMFIMTPMCKLKPLGIDL